MDNYDNNYFAPCRWLWMADVCVISKEGIRPKVQYQHRFPTTYLYGSYSPIDGDAFVYEMDGVSTAIFEAYLQEFSKHRPE